MNLGASFEHCVSRIVCCHCDRVAGNHRSRVGVGDFSGRARHDREGSPISGLDMVPTD